MKIRFLTAVIAVLFMSIMFVPAAHAGAAVETPAIPAAVETHTSETPAPIAPVTGYTETPPEPFTPPGTGTVVDYAADDESKMFYTITTPDEHIFYLVIDLARTTDNVYFLNTVTVDDLAPLAAPSEETPVVTPPVTEPVTEPEPTHEPESERGGSSGMVITVLVIVVLGGGAAYYFKIYRPKRQGAVSSELEDYSPEYDDDWDAQEPEDAYVNFGDEGGGDDR